MNEEDKVNEGDLKFNNDVKLIPNEMRRHWGRGRLKKEVIRSEIF